MVVFLYVALVNAGNDVLMQTLQSMPALLAPLVVNKVKAAICGGHHCEQAL